MDSMITAAARALAAGDPLGALKRVALRSDAPALALRGTAMAQLGDLARSKVLLRSAAREFGQREPAAGARCVIAQAEVALAARDLDWLSGAVENASATLERYGDHTNAQYGLCVLARRNLLTGKLGEAEGILARIDGSGLIPAMRAIYELTKAGIAICRIQAQAAGEALRRAAEAAGQAAIPALSCEIETAAQALAGPAARKIGRGQERVVALQEVECLLRSNTLVVDACRHRICHQDAAISFATRPVLFTILRRLAERFPQDVPRHELLQYAFGARLADESHRGRLRVEVGRLRRTIAAFAGIEATKAGFVVVPRVNAELCILAPPVEEQHAAILAVLADGEAWSSSALASAIEKSQRSTQRALEDLRVANKVQSVGHGPARRWTLRVFPGFATALLLTSGVLSE